MQRLTDMGADLVTTEERLKEDLAAAHLPAPALGLNCIGGSAAVAVAKTLRQVAACDVCLLCELPLALQGNWCHAVQP